MIGQQKMRAAGMAAENDARWHIDRTLKTSRNWRVLHDVVLFDRKADGWCQIDHLVFGRMGHFVVMETKSAREGMSLHEQSGAWSVWFNGKPKPMKSPISQNIRHIEVLGDYLKQCNVMPKRFGLSIAPAFANWVLVEPGCRVPKEYGGARLVQRDQFSQALDVFIEKIGVSDLLKVMLNEELARVFSTLEEESRENKRLRGLPSNPAEPPPIQIAESASHYQTSGFGHVLAEIAEAVITSPSPPPVARPYMKIVPCAKCGGELSSKEISYCRFNFAKFGRRYLCRNCQ